MSKIIFRKVRWKNFVSAGNNWIEVKLDNPKSTLIIGKNGSGKSTFLDAISFGLFNKPFRPVNKHDLVNSITDKDCLVEVEFDINAHHFKVIRGIKPNRFEIYKNDLLITQAAENKDYQDAFEKYILKINHKSFCQVVMLGSAVFTPFMQLPKAARREIIEDLLDLQIFTTMNMLLKSKIQDNENEISVLNNEKRLLEEKLKLTYQHIKEIQANTEKMLYEKKDRLFHTEEDIGLLKTTIRSERKELEYYLGKTKDQESVTSRLKEMNKLQTQLQHKIKHINKEISFLTDNENCPTCKQNIDGEFKKSALSEKFTDQQSVEKGLELLEDELVKANTRMNELLDIQDDINQTNKKINEAEIKVMSLESYAKTLQKDIENINNSVAQEVAKPVEMEEELSKVDKDLTNRSENKTLHGFAASMLKDEGIKARIIHSYIPIINQLLSKYCAALDFFVDFTLDESFKEIIKSRYRDQFSYGNFSQGEKMRLDLSILFTWRAIAKMRNSIDTNLIVFDEVLDGAMDLEGIDNMMKLLEGLTNGESIFIISHRDAVSDKFENIIQFEKHKNFSRVA
jgi:DNA repair exonuclease SbcCD ATPase subunit